MRSNVVKVLYHPKYYTWYINGQVALKWKTNEEVVKKIDEKDLYFDILFNRYLFIQKSKIFFIIVKIRLSFTVLERLKLFHEY